MCLIENIRAMRNAGQIKEALALAEEKFAVMPDRDLANELFWCLNYYSKAANNLQEKRNLFNRMLEIYREHLSYDTLIPTRLGWLIWEMMRITNPADANTRKMLLNDYFKLNVERPSKLHSYILNEAVVIEKNTPLEFRIRDFMRMWGWENLRDEDWEQFRTTAGNTLSSLVEKLVGAYARELKTDKVAPAPEFCELIDKALEKYPNSQYMPYYKAITLIADGKKDEAVEFYRRLIMRFPKKTYLWSHLSTLTEDVDARIGMLCNAVNTGDDEQFLVKIRLELASLLIGKGMMANAKYELDKYLHTYQTNGWHPRDEFYRVANRIPREVQSADNKQLYAEYSRFADKFVYGNLPTKYVAKVADKVYDDRNRPGRRYTVWTLMDGERRYTLKKPQKFGLNPRTANGTFFEIKESDGQIVWIEQVVPGPSSTWCRKVEGVVKTRTDRNGKAYCIIEGVYVGEQQLRGVVDGTPVSVVAMPRSGDRWSAVSLSPR